MSYDTFEPSYTPFEEPVVQADDGALPWTVDSCFQPVSCQYDLFDLGGYREDDEVDRDVQGRKHVEDGGGEDSVYGIGMRDGNTCSLVQFPFSNEIITTDMAFRTHLKCQLPAALLIDEYGKEQPLTEIRSCQLPPLQAKLWRDLPRFEASQTLLSDYTVTREDIITAGVVKWVADTLASDHVFVIRTRIPSTCSYPLCQILHQRWSIPYEVHEIALEPTFDLSTLTPDLDHSVLDAKILVFQRDRYKYIEFGKLLKRCIPDASATLCAPCLEFLWKQRVQAWTIMDRYIPEVDCSWFPARSESPGPDGVCEVSKAIRESRRSGDEEGESGHGGITVVPAFPPTLESELHCNSHDRRLRPIAKTGKSSQLELTQGPKVLVGDLPQMAFQLDGAYDADSEGGGSETGSAPSESGAGVAKTHVATSTLKETETGAFSSTNGHPYPSWTAINNDDSSSSPPLPSTLPHTTHRELDPAYHATHATASNSFQSKFETVPVHELYRGINVNIPTGPLPGVSGYIEFKGLYFPCPPSVSLGPVFQYRPRPPRALKKLGGLARPDIIAQAERAGTIRGQQRSSAQMTRQYQLEDSSSPPKYGKRLGLATGNALRSLQPTSGNAQRLPSLSQLGQALKEPRLVVKPFSKPDERKVPDTPTIPTHSPPSSDVGPAVTVSPSRARRVVPAASYCYCRKPDDGSIMVKCSNPDCAIGWLHYTCLDKSQKLSSRRNDDWLCQVCRAQKRATVQSSALSFKNLFTKDKIICALSHSAPAIANPYGMGLPDTYATGLQSPPPTPGKLELPSVYTTSEDEWKAFNSEANGFMEE